eukprot:sb/3474173/
MLQSTGNTPFYCYSWTPIYTGTPINHNPDLPGKSLPSSIPVNRGPTVILLIKKGWLSTTNVGLTKGLSREYWFVLYTDALAWYKDESERDQKYYLNIDGIKMKSTDEDEEHGGFFHRKFKINLFNPNARYLFREYRELSIS